MMSERECRREIVQYGKMLYGRGMIAATDGNISVRLNNTSILVTPTCMCKGLLEESDLVIVDNHGRKLHGDRDVSSEIGMHVLIYAMRPDIHGIVHAHPPTATGFAAAGIALDQPLISEVVLTLGSIPLAPYATPGTDELVDVLRPLVPHHNAILMANHGVVTYAEDLSRAFMHMETAEHFAKIALVTRTIGQQQLISSEDVRKLDAIRFRLAARANAGSSVPAAEVISRQN